MTNHLALWGFAEFAFCLTRMNPEMVYLHQDSGFLNVSYYKFDTDDVTGMMKRLAPFYVTDILLQILLLKHGTRCLKLSSYVRKAKFFQCFDTVDWVSGKVYGLEKKLARSPKRD